jgi:hypothetical protein
MNRRLLLAMAIVPLLTVSKAKADGVTVRWDILHFTTFSPPTFTVGGPASAKAEDLSKITLTGSGTFQLGEDGGVTGGGTWHTFAPGGAPTGSGTYVVTGLIKFNVAPGSLPSPPVVDLIGSATAAHSGLAFLRILYSDGTRGVLAFGCALPVGTPASLFEGITASKGYVDYWNHEEAMPGVDGDRTAFHITASEDD